jgi:hypothetical protein
MRSWIRISVFSILWVGCGRSGLDAPFDVSTGGVTGTADGSVRPGAGGAGGIEVGGDAAAGAAGGSAGAGSETAGAWTNLTPTSLPVAWPEARSTHALAYDAARDQIVLFAGSHTLHDLWEWNPATGVWTNRTPSTLPASWPPPLYGHAMVYDAGRKRMFVFGGGTTVGVLADSWEWDGAAGTWQKRTPAGSPPALNSHAMTYDGGRGKVVLFGGFRNDIGGVSSDLWEWDGAAGTWTNRKRASSAAAWPSARDGTSLVFDGARNRAILFGGFDNAGGTFADVWEWDGTSGTWSNRTPAAPTAPWPEARSNHAAVFDVHRDTMVVFGGASGGAVGADLWEWSGTSGTWIERVPATASTPWPSARAAHAMAYDAKRFTAMLFGGSPLNDDLWAWQGP